MLEPDTFTIGFARRFATYKRATLLFRDVERLKRLLTNKEWPVQIVIAGKAHPRDLPGKTLIREIVQLSRAPEIAKHIVFVEDYSIGVARELVQGVDMWLNTPRRGEEACGTSGMKAGINGILNFSILDGWFDEGYEISGGWAIGDREPYSDDQDEIHARAIYSMLENEIVPMYYQDRDEGIPVDWMRRVKQILMHLSPQFNCQRMIGEYVSQIYEPAHQAYLDVSQRQFRAGEGTFPLERAGAGGLGRGKVCGDWAGSGCFGVDGAAGADAGAGGSGRFVAQGCACGSGDRTSGRERKSGRNAGDESAAGSARRGSVPVPEGVCSASDRQAGVLAANQS